MNDTTSNSHFQSMSEATWVREGWEGGTESAPAKKVKAAEDNNNSKVT